MVSTFSQTKFLSIKWPKICLVLPMLVIKVPPWQEPRLFAGAFASRVVSSLQNIQKQLCAPSGRLLFFDLSPTAPY